MKKLMRFFVVFLLSLSCFLFPPHSLAIDPFPPYSVEGNPTREEYFDIFDLFRFIRAPFFKVFENRDITRDYVPLMICEYSGADRRDQVCSVDNQTGGIVDTCDGGEVDLCERKYINGRGEYNRTVTSKSGTCTANRNPDKTGVTTGECKYRKKPRIGSDIKATDFSAENRILNQSTGAEPKPNPFGGLVFPKIQNEALLYGNMGSDNAITWGTHFLSLTQCDIMTKQLMVVLRAKQTKNTRAETGEWPLGWVDWGYTTQNGKTLLEIRDEIPGGMAGQGQIIVEATDDFFLNAGNLDAVSDASSSRKKVCDTIEQAASQKPPPQWFTDLSQVPMYSPSFRQGYVHASICKFDLCCPGENCPFGRDTIDGNSNALYGDISISQVFGAALDDLLLSYPLQEASKIMRDLASANQLVRFAGSAAPNATPSKIKARLIPELMANDPCFKYHFGSYGAFYQLYDYLDTPSFLDDAKQCPGYRLQPDVTKEKGAAFPNENGLLALINLIWSSPVDDVEPITYHLITVPDAMGQSIAEIKQYVYDTRDTSAELDAVKDYNAGLSNVIDDNLDLLKAGKSSGPADGRRHYAYYTCDDNMFSAQLKTSVEAYALGTRIGCFDTTTVPEGKCDGRLFGELIEGSKYQDISPKAQDYFTSVIEPNLSAEVMNTYAAAEAETGVPCEVFAAMHFVEANNNPNGSLISGRALGTPEPDAGGKIFRSLMETAIYSADNLLGKVGGKIDSAQTLITALSRRSGGGNSNCQQGYPYPIPYTGCPREFEGEDDAYPVNWLDARHDTMYLLFCADRTQCVPQIWQRPGAFTVALAVYNNMTKGGYENSTLPSPSPVPIPPSTDSSTDTGTGFFPDSCAPDSLTTALGCIPYTREAFTSALFTFLIGLSGGIAIVVMLVAIFQIMTAGGNEEQLKKGKELFTAAVTGLLFLIFSVALLRIIAGDIIKLPGFIG